MDLLEHQGKALFAAAGLPVPPGRLAGTGSEAAAAAHDLGLPVAVKAQVRAGGRGKAGGVRLCRSAEEVRAAADEVLRMSIAGCPVEAVLVEQGVAVAREAYLAVALSRHHRGPLLVFAAEGGVDVEELARTRPEAVLTTPIDPLLGICDYQARAVMLAMAAMEVDSGDPRGHGRGGAFRRGGVTSAAVPGIVDVVRGLWRVYRERDATLVEVNPLVVTADGEVVCLDAKVTVDDNALWRQPELAALGPPPDERERCAREAGLSFITLDGDIGVIGNGAGLVMSTLDQLAAAGGRAADFCDVGGGASAEAVALALGLVLSGAGVRALAVNIFGGITRGDEVARGLVQALRATPAAGSIPVVVRLAGTAAGEGRAVLAGAGLANVRLVGDVDELVRLACAAAASAAPGGRVASSLAREGACGGGGA